MRKAQLKVLEKHKILLEFIIVVGKKRIRLDQLKEILIQVGYCKDEPAVSRVIRELIEEKLIHEVKSKRNKIIELPTPVIRHLMGEKSSRNKIAGVVRDQRAAMSLALFKREYLDKGHDLESGMNAMREDGFNLFTDSSKYYDFLTSQTEDYASVVYCSFDNRYSTIFKQKKEMRNRLKRQQAHIEMTARTRQKTGQSVKVDKKIWILDDLKARSVYLKNIELKEIEEFNKDNNWVQSWYNAIDVKPYEMDLNFVFLVHEWNPSEDNMLKQLMRLYKYVRTSFRFHCPFFLREKRIKTSAVKINIHVDVVLMNDIAYQNVNQEKLTKKIKRVKSKGEYVLNEWRYPFNVTFSHVDVNCFNEHLLKNKKNNN